MLAHPAVEAGHARRPRSGDDRARPRRSRRSPSSTGTRFDDPRVTRRQRRRDGLARRRRRGGCDVVDRRLPRPEHLRARQAVHDAASTGCSRARLAPGGAVARAGTSPLFARALVLVHRRDDAGGRASSCGRTRSRCRRSACGASRSRRSEPFEPPRSAAARCALRFLDDDGARRRCSVFPPRHGAGRRSRSTGSTTRCSCATTRRSGGAGNDSADDAVAARLRRRRCSARRGAAASRAAAAAQRCPTASWCGPARRARPPRCAIAAPGASPARRALAARARRRRRRAASPGWPRRGGSSARGVARRRRARARRRRRAAPRGAARRRSRRIRGARTTSWRRSASRRALVALLGEMGVIEATRADGEPVVAEHAALPRARGARVLPRPLVRGAVPARRRDAPTIWRSSTRFQREIDRWVAWRDAQRPPRLRDAGVARAPTTPSVTALDRISMARLARRARPRLAAPALARRLRLPRRLRPARRRHQRLGGRLLLRVAPARAPAPSRSRSSPGPRATAGSSRTWRARLGAAPAARPRGRRSVRPQRRGVEVVGARPPTARVGVRAERVIVAAPQFVAASASSRRCARARARARRSTAARGWSRTCTCDSRPREPRSDAPLAWDNVLYDSPSLGYVVATHQSGRDHGPTVFTWYYPVHGRRRQRRRRALDWRDRETGPRPRSPTSRARTPTSRALSSASTSRTGATGWCGRGRAASSTRRARGARAARPHPLRRQRPAAAWRCSRRRSTTACAPPTRCWRARAACMSGAAAGSGSSRRRSTCSAFGGAGGCSRSPLVAARACGSASADDEPGLDLGRRRAAASTSRTSGRPRSSSTSIRASCAGAAPLLRWCRSLGWVLGVALYALGGATLVLARARVPRGVPLRAPAVRLDGAVPRPRRRAEPRWSAGSTAPRSTLATLYPLVWWHAHLPRALRVVPARRLPAPGLPERLMRQRAGRGVRAGARPRTSAARVQQRLRGRAGAVGQAPACSSTTAATWYVGIVATNSDLAFTVTNVLIHGVPYAVLVFSYGRHVARGVAERGLGRGARGRAVLGGGVSASPLPVAARVSRRSCSGIARLARSPGVVWRRLRSADALQVLARAAARAAAAHATTCSTASSGGARTIQSCASGWLRQIAPLTSIRGSRFRALEDLNGVPDPLG